MWQYNYSQPLDELMHYGKLGMRWGKRTSSEKTAYKQLKKDHKVEVKEFRKLGKDVHNKNRSTKELLVSKRAKNGYPKEYMNKHGERFTPKEIDAGLAYKVRKETQKYNIKRAIKIGSATVPVMIGIAKAFNTPEIKAAASVGMNFLKTVDLKSIKYDSINKAFTGASKIL